MRPETSAKHLRNTPLRRQPQAASEAVIKISRFQVPSQVRPGEHRRLACLYELQGATLHAMKLFKDNKEVSVTVLFETQRWLQSQDDPKVRILIGKHAQFYRYTPADHKMTFPVLGVQVDLNRSGEREVWIRTGKRSGGSYKCQVSIEGTFNSVIEEKRMEVVEGPPATNWHQKEPTQRTHNNNNNLNRAQPVHQNQQMTFAGTTGNSNQPLSHQFFSSSSSSSSGCLCWISQMLQLISLLLTSCLIFRAHLASFVPPTSHLEDKRKVEES